jgi:hypothetical protein
MLPGRVGRCRYVEVVIGGGILIAGGTNAPALDTTMTRYDCSLSILKTKALE